MPTDGKMLHTYKECKKMFGSPYQIAKAIADGRIRKLDDGVYSDTGEENERDVA